MRDPVTGDMSLEGEGVREAGREERE